MERALIAVALLAALATAIVLVRAVLERRRLALVQRLRSTEREPDRAYRILYFTTEFCAECKLLQRPALAELQRRFGPRLEVQTVDALERGDLAREYGVRTVPTTAVFGSTGTLVDVNYGFASAERLALQLTSN